MSQHGWIQTNTIDPALVNSNYLISKRIQTPTDDQQQQTVGVLVHGFSASSYEFRSLVNRLELQDPSVLLSRVVMGGHGRDYNAFKNATYSDWEAPILAEVTALANNGHQSIALIGTSTGATAVLHLLLSGAFADLPVKQLILIDPYIEPKDKRLLFVPLLRFFVGNTRSNASQALEHQHWYTNRPTAALYELVKLMRNVRQQLNSYPVRAKNDWPKITVFTAKNDPTADTAGADMIQAAFGSDMVDVHRYDSDHHVIIEPTTKSTWSLADQQHYDFVLNRIRLLLKN